MDINRELCRKLGIEWHEVEPIYMFYRNNPIYKCSCGKMFGSEKLSKKKSESVWIPRPMGVPRYCGDSV